MYVYVVVIASFSLSESRTDDLRGWCRSTLDETSLIGINRERDDATIIRRALAMTLLPGARRIAFDC